MRHPKELLDLTGRVAVVTGAGGGLGRRAATVLYQAGASVIAVDRREAQLQEWQAEMQQQTTLCENKTHIIVFDLMDGSKIPDLAAQCQSAFPTSSPDIIVHAAGINTRQVADEVTVEKWDATLHLNLTVIFFLTQALIEPMKEQKWGRVVNFASLQSTRAFEGGVAYGASKAGLAQLTRSMAQAWSPHGITANCIGPGFFPTELTSVVFQDDERAKQNAQQTCIGRNGIMEDLDGPLLFLCSDASQYVTGQVLMVDGGYTAK